MTWDFLLPLSSAFMGVGFGLLIGTALLPSKHSGSRYETTESLDGSTFTSHGEQRTVDQALYAGGELWMVLYHTPSGRG